MLLFYFHARIDWSLIMLVSSFLILFFWKNKDRLNVYLIYMQVSLKTEREKKKKMYFPVRKYAIKV